MIQLKNITKTYGSGKNAVTALKNLSIDFGSKGLVVILGKSGCGKSTLLNIMGGLDKANIGELIIDGRSTKSFSSSEFDSYRNTYVGMVFQEFNLIDEITVYQNIEITLKLQRKNTDINTVDEVLSMVGLGSLGYRKPSELSGGQRQRVALARALLKKPQILLADEPTGALDVSTSEEVFEVLKKLARTQLVVVVTHDRELAFSYGERIIELVDGEIVSDKEIQLDSYSPVKVLSDNVIEVAAGGEISANDINQKLKQGVFNYIGISHDKDRIALAYPDTFDLFYLPKEKIKMRNTNKQDIASDENQFKLQKGTLALKDAIKMAKVNKKRTKKRYRFITFLNTLCFALLGLSFVLSMVNLPEVIAKSAFDTYSQDVVAVTPLVTDYYYQSESPELLDSEYDEIKNLIGSRKVHKVFKTNLFPYYAISEQTGNISSIAGSFMSALSNIDISINYYTGLIEGEKLSDLGIPLIKNGGVDFCEGFNEIIISDFAAQKLIQRGFFGLDNQGNYGSYFPEKIEDIVGMSVNFVNLGKEFKIAGIFKTDYLRYNYLNKTEERVSMDARIDITNWDNNKEFLYSKIFVKNGFIDSLFEQQKTQISFDIIAQRRQSISIELETIKYNIDYFKNPLDESSNAFLWVSDNQSFETEMPDGSIQLFPSMSNNGVIVSLQLMNALFPSFDASQDIYMEFGRPVLNPSYQSLEMFMNQNVYYVPIIAVYDASNFAAPKPFAVGTYLYRLLEASATVETPYYLESVMFYKGKSFNDLKKLANKLIDNEYLMYSSVGSVQEILQLGDMFGTTAKIFLYISLAVAAFSFLLILNYMSSSVRFRAKEIAVYRVVGARRIDVAKIFLTEGMMLVFSSTVFSSILGAIVTYLVKLSAKQMLQIFNLSFSIFSFNLLTIAMIFVSITALVMIASLLPIISITRRKAIEALKVIG